MKASGRKQLPENFGLDVKANNMAEVTFGNLIRAADLAQRQINSFLKDHELTLSRYNVLRTIAARKGEGVPVLTIAAELLSYDPDITRLLDRMVKEGLVKRKRSEEDRRVVLVYLTPKGNSLSQKLKTPLVKQHQKNTVGLSGAELKKLNHLLYRLQAD